MHKRSEVLFDRLTRQCKQHIQTLVDSLINTDTADYSTFLPALERCWLRHCDQMLTIRSIFLYLDRTYVIQQSAIPVRSIWELGLNLFGEFFLLPRASLGDSHSTLSSVAISGLLDSIARERHGEMVNRALLKTLMRMLSALKLYKSQLEPSLIDSTRQFYSNEGQRLVDEVNSSVLSVEEYLHHAQRRLNEESERINQYLEESSQRALISTVEQTLMAAHSRAILGASTGASSLLKTKRLDSLRLMYKLLQRVEKLDELKESMSEYIKKAGKELVDVTGEAEQSMVQNLLNFKSSLDEIQSFAFDSNADFAYALKLAFEFFINAQETKTAEAIAKFIDRLLRSGGSKGATNEELESTLDRVMFLFRYIHSKDIFQAFYKKDLAKRLLLNKSASIDAEKSMIAKIKLECGASFTNKLEGMFKDIELSKDIQIEFAAHLKSIPNLPELDISVQVLTTGCWPNYEQLECTLPKEITLLQEEFKTFYLSKHSGRRLFWQNPLASAIVRANFPKGRKELAVSGFQAAILMLFNEAETLTYKEIAAMSKLDEKELKRTLLSLSCQDSVRVLLKEPKNKRIGDDDTFQVDLAFKNPLFRVKINQLQMKETKEEQSATQAKVFEDRQYAIDACIVRIMKARKTLTHNQLMSEVFTQLKFPAKPADIKKRIATLIEREYMERDKDNSSVYNYQA